MLERKKRDEETSNVTRKRSPQVMQKESTSNTKLKKLCSKENVNEPQKCGSTWNGCTGASM